MRAEGATDQELTIAVIEEAARRIDGRAPYDPLLAALPANLLLDELGDDRRTRLRSAVRPGREPSAQAQPVEYLDLTGVDRLVVTCGPQSGRTTFAP